MYVCAVGGGGRAAVQQCRRVVIGVKRHASVLPFFWLTCPNAFYTWQGGAVCVAGTAFFSSCNFTKNTAVSQICTERYMRCASGGALNKACKNLLGCSFFHWWSLKVKMMFNTFFMPFLCSVYSPAIVWAPPLSRSPVERKISKK